MFSLDKWYFDCVAQDNSAAIGYAAKLRYGILRIRYGAVIRADRDGVCTQKQSFSFGEIRKEQDCLTWENNALSIRGEWKGKYLDDDVTLYEGAEGSINWNCITPAATVSIYHAGSLIVGNGYAEHLRITVPPWKLPFHELKWGRFISDDLSKYCIWIDWKGAVRRNWIWTEQGLGEGTITLRDVAFGDERIEFHEQTDIRSGEVTESLLGKRTFLSNLLPKKLRTFQENKHVCKCTRSSSDILPVRGTAIFEEVSWQR
jgi:hypothetical protein